jgi:predicted aldo/keto reductase-like oxidoreductase
MASDIPRRPYGDTDDLLSIIGFGGIVVMNAEQDHANRVVAEAFDRGVNYFDVAPGYGDAEIKLGPALAPYRKDAFLACKTSQRTRAEADAEFERSLERLKTDHFDLYQLHGLIDMEQDVEPVFHKGGVVDMMVERQKAGQIRYLGFSAHSVQAACAALDRFDFDSVLFPFNFGAWKIGNFGPQVVEKAQEKGAARLALKAMAKSNWVEGDPKRESYGKCWYEPLTDPEEAVLGLRWTLSQPITAALPPGEERLFRIALDAATNLPPITPGEEERLTQIAREAGPLFEAGAA